MEGLIIRRAEIKDVQAVQHLNNALINYEIENGFDNYIKDWALSEESKNYFLDLIKNQFVVVAEVDGKIVGYLLDQFITICHIHTMKAAQLKRTICLLLRTIEFMELAQN